MPAGSATGGLAVAVPLVRRKLRTLRAERDALIKANARPDPSPPPVQPAAPPPVQPQPQLAPNVVERKQVEYVHVPTTDHEFNLLVDAMATEVSYNPSAAPVVERIRSLFDQKKGGAPYFAKLRTSPQPGTTMGWRDQPQEPKS